MERFGLSNRLAVRLGALYAKGLGVSETLVEMMAQAPPLQALLLDASLLSDAESLSPERVAQLQAAHDAHGFFASNPLALAGGPPARSLRVLCLEEEVLAATADSTERGDVEPATTQATPPNDEPGHPHALAASDAAAGGSLSAHRAAGSNDFRSLFTGEDVARLRLTVLTSTDPKAKVEAIRKLRFVELEPSERAALLLQAIQDDDADVRREAVTGLTDLGLSERLAEAVGELCVGDETQRQAVLLTLERLSQTVQPAELRVMFAVLVGTLRARDSTVALRRGLLHTLRAVAVPVVGEDAGALRELHRQLSKLLAGSYDDLSTDVYLVYKAARSAPGLVALIRAAFDEAADPRLRAFYLSLLAEIAPDRESLQALVKEMADRAIRGNELDAVSARLAAALRGYGEAGVLALLDQLDHLNEDKKETTVALLSTVFAACTLPPGTSDTIARKLLDVYGVSAVQVRMTILDCPFLVRPDVADDTRRALADTLLDDMHEHRLEQSQQHVASVIRRLGPAVLPVLRRSVSRNRYAITRQWAAEIAGRIGSAFQAKYFPDATGEIDVRLTERLMRLRAGQAIGVMGLGPRSTANAASAPAPDEAEVAEIRETLASFLQHLSSDDYSTKSPLYVAAGRLAATGVVPADTLRPMVSTFLDLTRASSDTYAIVEALGYLGIARDLPTPVRAEIATFLGNLLRAKYPERLSRVRQTEDGPVFDIGHETTAYTDLLPRVMKGIERMMLSHIVDPTLRNNLLEKLLEAWDDLVESRTIWSPKNVTDLAEIQGQIGQCELYEQHHRNRIIDALIRKSESLVVKSILGELIGSGEDSARMAGMALHLFRDLTRELLEDESLETYERRAILSTMCRIALRARIGTTDQDAHEVRNEVVNYCLEAVRDGMVDLAEPLRLLAKKPFVEAELADEIMRRLRRFKLVPEGE